MQGIDLSRPGEKKKLIWLGLLGFGAILILWWALIGFGSGTRTTAVRPTPTPAPQRPTTTAGQRSSQPATPDLVTLAAFTVVDYRRSSYEPPAATRNIFAFYVPPPTPSPSPTQTPTPPPPPPAPILLASVSPSNVYARTADFKLEVAGDKFTPQLHIFVDGRELPTSYKGPQQMSTTIPASFIAAPGVRQVVVRTPDNRLYSDPMTINVAAPPIPNYTYIGIISPTNRVTDTALVQERGKKDVVTVARGDVLGGRFRVTSITEKELVLTDTSLKIKHSLPMSEGDKTAGGPLSRPTPRVDSEDDEP